MTTRPARRLGAALGVAAVLATSLGIAAPASTAAPVAEERVAVAAPGYVGKWRGTVHQRGFDPYRATVTIRRTDAGVLKGRVVYADCSGVWRFRRTEDGWKKFTEVITRDPGAPSCVPRLGVKAKRVDARLRVIWTYQGETATMLARRV